MSARPSALPSAAPFVADCVSAAASASARCHATNSRAWRTLQCADASRSVASLDGEATSAKGSTRSSDSSPEANPSARHGSDSSLVAARTHCRAVAVLTPHRPVTQEIMDTAPSPRHPSARSNSAMSANCSRWSDAIRPDRFTICPASSRERGSAPKFRHAGRRRKATLPPLDSLRPSGGCSVPT